MKRKKYMNKPNKHRFIQIKLVFNNAYNNFYYSCNCCMLQAKEEERKHDKIKLKR